MKVSELVMLLNSVCPDFDVVIEDIDCQHFDVESVQECEGKVIIDVLS